jgi:hypothetical protein
VTKNERNKREIYRTGERERYRTGERERKQESKKTREKKKRKKLRERDGLFEPVDNNASFSLTPHMLCFLCAKNT